MAMKVYTRNAEDLLPFITFIPFIPVKPICFNEKKNLLTGMEGMKEMGKGEWGWAIR